METQLERRWTPLVVVATILAIAYIAMARLPESYVAQLARSRPLESVQADWAYRLLVFAAIAQAAYGGFVLLHTDRIGAVLAGEGRKVGLTRQRVLTLVVRNAATMIGLTFIYGLAAFVITGQRGGFWLFALITALQGAWYFRQVNEIASFLDFQQEPEPERTQSTWRKPPPDYSPPIVRGLQSPAPSQPLD